MDPKHSPQSLQRKLQFDLRFFLCQHGMENIQHMQKTDFQLKYSTKNEEWLVIKVKDELTKNHRNMENLISGVMPENKTDPMCPVASFKAYQDHLHPDNPYMWQAPLDKIDPEHPEIWFSKKKHIRKNPLSTFMSDLSRDAKLSRRYTNHSIRSTGITVLTNCRYSNADMMALSGHKSVQSLAVYQKTDETKKIQMGKLLAQCLTPKEHMKQILPPQEKDVLQAPESLLQLTESASTIKENVTNENAIILFNPNFEDHDEIPDFDLLSAICDIEEPKETNENENVVKPSLAIEPSVANTCTSNVVNQIPRSFFANCQIGTIN